MSSPTKGTVAGRPLALVTGATVGIGYELARLLARDRHVLAIVARSETKLRQVAEQLSAQHGVDVTWVALDLSVSGAALDLHRRLAGRAVDVLVNNAGVGVFGAFAEADGDAAVRMIRLNVEAPTHLTRLVLPEMLRRDAGRILNVASTAAFQPGPLMAVYYATKAYLLHFGEALDEELHGTGVTVTTLCPGPTATEFQQRAGMEDSGLMRHLGVMDAASVAKAGYRGMLRGRRLVIPGLTNRLGSFSVRLTPRRLVTRIVRRIQQE